MAPSAEEGQDTGIRRIKPAKLDLSAGVSAPPPAPGKRRTFRDYLLATGIVVLLASAGAVIFVLPEWVSPPQVAEPAPAELPARPQSGASSSPSPGTPSGAASVAEAPWQRAQEAELRKDTQDILAELLDAQKILTEKGVKAWAGEEFQSALKHAQAGDQEYSRQDYRKAHAEYSEALRILSELKDRVDTVFHRSMADGNQALEDGNSEKAKAAFDVALAIDSLDRAAQQGRARSQTLDQVLELVDQGDQLMQAGKLEEAKANYQKALGVDGLSARAKERLATVESKIRDRDFNQAMSEGFAALDSGRLDQAHRSFNKALQIKPGSREAQGGLEQAQSRIRTSRINSLLAEARELESQEKWHDALAKYEAVLELDNGLSVAVDGKERTSTRAAVHDRLAEILDNPKRLYDQQVYEETLAFFRKLVEISDPGPVLAGQLESLGAQLKKAHTPIEVQFLSDNQTRVTLYKVGELGSFASKTLSLLPGRYVVVGVREGYQDARREFFVDPDKRMEPIRIQADEKIALGK